MVGSGKNNRDIRHMALSNGIHRVHIRGLILSQRWEMIQAYDVDDLPLTPITAAQLGEAYWNNIKGDFRAALVTSASLITESVFIEDISPSGDYGEYPIPSGEQQGTRSGAGLGDFMPPFAAVGVRLTVGSRVTRPGQKRFPGVCEGDQANGVLASGIRDATALAALKFVETLTLGSPVLLATMTPMIVRLDAATGALEASQAVTGRIVSPNVTTQNSRKIGRGI